MSVLNALSSEKRAIFEHIPAYAGDPILGLMEAFTSDLRPEKVNLGIGLYHDEQGQIPLMPVVARAELALAAKARTRPYLPIEGSAAYRGAVQYLVFGRGHEAVVAERIATVQTIGGSGALRVGADFMRRYFPASKVWISDPSWDNHRVIFEGAGFEVGSYPYYDAQTGGVRFEEMLASLWAMPPQSIVLFQPCCHNPTGVDLSEAQWKTVIALLKERALIPFLDMAYQGFGDGLEEDAFAIRALAETGIQFFISNSFSKNMSYYGERCGGLSVVCANREEAERVLGQLKFTIRRNYSSPPTHGGHIVAQILSDPTLRAEWEREVTAMRLRTMGMRRELLERLAGRSEDGEFDYLMAQRGMFSYTGFSPEQVQSLREDFGIYMVRSGRMCVAGLNRQNLDYVAEAMSAVAADRACLV